jgi:hypothetical protein
MSLPLLRFTETVYSTLRKCRIDWLAWKPPFGPLFARGQVVVSRKEAATEKIQPINHFLLYFELSSANSRARIIIVLVKDF